MDPEILETVLHRLVGELLLEDRLTISWHGAEPLAAGLAWYESAFRTIESVLDRAVRVSHVFQTNGVLLSNEWCSFIKEHDATIGVSLDGSEEQNAARVNWAGRPAYRSAMRGVELLNRNGIAWTLLSVVTRATMEDPTAFVNFVRSTGCSNLGFKVEETNVSNTSQLELGGVDVEAAYTNFVRALWEAFPENDLVRVREFDGYRAARSSSPRKQAVPVTLIPLRNLTVAVNGDFTIFAGELLFQDDDSFVFGNVLDGPLLDCLKSDRFNMLAEDILSGVQKCATNCEHYGDCGSFYISQKFAETGSFDADETLACRLEMKTMYKALDGMHR